MSVGVQQRAGGGRGGGAHAAGAGHQAYLVGGCVRDLLLGHAPKDYDVATNARRMRCWSCFAEPFGVGAHFGVVLVPLRWTRQEIVTEVATFRTDGAYSDGRRPDAVRSRTIRSRMCCGATSPSTACCWMSMSIWRAAMRRPRCSITWAGARTCEAGVVRAIGEPMRRFTEDKLRMLRAVRFAARFGFTIEPETFAAIRVLAREIGQVSRERMRDELTRMLTEGHAAACI